MLLPNSRRRVAWLSHPPAMRARRFLTAPSSLIVPAQQTAGGKFMRIGVAGIGKMGAAIASRLIEVGHEVAVWNRTAEKAKAVAGATAVATPAELARRSDAVITILTAGAAIEAVYHVPSGLISGDVKDRLFIEMSTVPPKVETALAPMVQAKGAAFVECPVGGSTAPARQGKLLGLLGGEDGAAACARPI